MLRPTRAGWIFFAIVFAVGFAALNTGNNLLYLVLSLMLGFLALSGVLSESALRGIAVGRRLPRELYAGAPNPVLLEISNGLKRVPAFAIAVEDLMFPPGAPRRRPHRAPAAGRVFALRVAPQETETRRYAFRPEQRGLLHFAGFRVSTRFPFGLFAKFRSFEEAQEVLVFPEIEPRVVLSASGDARETGVEITAGIGLGCEVAGLRDFEHGDPRRRIHWRSSLRRGSLLVTHVEDERDRRVEIYLRTGDRPDPGRFERRVRRAASEVVGHLDAGFGVSLRTDSTQLPFGRGDRHRRHLLSFLALVEPAATASQSPHPEAAGSCAA